MKGRSESCGGTPRRFAAWTASPVVLGCLLAACGGQPPLEADLILRHARIVTGAGNVEALAVREGRVIAAGGDAVVDDHRGPKTIDLDLKGATVLPGFRDPLADPLLIGERLLNEATGGDLYLDLSDAQSEEDVVQRARARARALGPGAWIFGRDWDETRWVQPRPPDRRLISDIVASNPVLLLRRGGGAGWVNKQALDLAGQRGEGIVEGAALLAVLRHATPLTPEERQKGILAALDQAASMGITEVQAIAGAGRLGLKDAQATEEAILGTWRALARSGRLPVRVGLLVPAPGGAAESVLIRDATLDPAATRLELKLLLDPALGAEAGGWCARAQKAGAPCLFAAAADPAALQTAQAACKGSGLDAAVAPAATPADRWPAPHLDGTAAERGLTRGEKADFVIVAAPAGGGTMRIESTWVGGREVYRRAG
jgi:predicted amidohydrolase YtcJ